MGQLQPPSTAPIGRPDQLAASDSVQSCRQRAPCAARELPLFHDLHGHSPQVGSQLVRAALERPLSLHVDRTTACEILDRKIPDVISNTGLLGASQFATRTARFLPSAVGIHFCHCQLGNNRLEIRSSMANFATTMPLLGAQLRLAGGRPPVTTIASAAVHKAFITPVALFPPHSNAAAPPSEVSPAGPALVRWPVA
ncbi:hypothetical protein PMIN06_007513 [Paraphaeosphaeria minitans]|uniref:Uncharacterized protein n=1 Tax=Paraphaeosphaeria minitans TaxID=565426 RepID=A0A9P6GFN5_9PLEO|nr:hypothetical protein PMIN01_08992 [Paraphaeosphaeria minitans]